jgi:formate hydrogenlyase subunit 3/multisubunit Na+/H+ antiporter MnhD subunit
LNAALQIIHKQTVIMQKTLFEAVNLLAIAAIISIPFFKTKGRGLITLSVVTIQVIINTILAVSILSHGPFEFEYPGSWVTGAIPVRIDELSAWFILIISFTFLTGSWYGFQYMKQYTQQADSIALHAIAYLLVYTSLVDICVVQNGIVFIAIWEIMALSSFIIIIFEHEKTETLKAGINFLIQSHVCILFLTIAFMWVKIKTGSFDFEAITAYTSSQPAIIGVGLFVCFFMGFAIKAGFVPFHTWLPLAHPAAPAHISGVMSGVIIKIGIYGIFRVLMLLKTDMAYIGYIILFVSVITGVYGVMLAIIQHNLKKLLAYHSIENIGIIGIGIGIGCLGLGYNNPILLVTGFAGALLHTLNHSLFKSLLFYCAGNVYQAKHSMNIESMGGLIKQMPRSAYLFLIGSLAICGLPPFNGFVSEFFIYSGLFKGLISDNSLLLLFLLFSLLGLVLIGGLAIICFTKAFGIVFLGTPREKSQPNLECENPLRIAPMILVAIAIVTIGLFPFFFNSSLLQIISLYQPSGYPEPLGVTEKTFDTLTVIGWYSLSFIILMLFFYLVRRVITSKRQNSADVTWGCGYNGETAKIQYTASSFIRSYRKLAEPILEIKKDKKDVTGIFPNDAKHETHPYDKLELWLIDKPIFYIRRILNRFTFLQNGNLQAYILYGFIFIGLVILLPVVVNKLTALFHFFNQL